MRGYAAQGAVPQRKSSTECEVRRTISSQVPWRDQLQISLGRHVTPLPFSFLEIAKRRDGKRNFH